MLLRQAAGLDRSVDRKVRILMAMRKEQESRGAPGGRPVRAGTRSSEEAGVKGGATKGTTESPTEESASAIPKSPEQSQNVAENKQPAAEGSEITTPAGSDNVAMAEALARQSDERRATPALA